MAILTELRFTEDPYRDTGLLKKDWKIWNPGKWPTPPAIAPAPDGSLGLDLTTKPGTTANLYGPSVVSSISARSIVGLNKDWSLSLWSWTISRGDITFWNTLYSSRYANTAYGLSYDVLLSIDSGLTNRLQVSTLGGPLLNASTNTVLKAFPVAEVYDRWTHLLTCFNSAKKEYRFFFNGELVLTKTLSASQNDWLTYDSNAPILLGSRYTISPQNRDFRYTGYLRSLEIHDKPLETANFDPQKYWRTYPRKIYVAVNGDIFTQGDSGFQQLTGDWNALSNPDKESVLKTAGTFSATSEDLATISPFKILKYSDTSFKEDELIKAVPKNQLISPVRLINLKPYAAIHKVSLATTISGSSDIKIAITTDLQKYMVYDTATSAWVDVDASTADKLLENGMSANDLAKLTNDEWNQLKTQTKAKKVAFAYAFSQDTLNDNCKSTALTLLVDLISSWDSCIQGTDYTYTYNSSETLQVTLLQTGEYKINYSAGPA